MSLNHEQFEGADAGQKLVMLGVIRHVNLAKLTANNEKIGILVSQERKDKSNAEKVEKALRSNYVISGDERKAIREKCLSEITQAKEVIAKKAETLLTANKTMRADNRQADVLGAKATQSFLGVTALADYVLDTGNILVKPAKVKPKTV